MLWLSPQVILADQLLSGLRTDQHNDHLLRGAMIDWEQLRFEMKKDGFGGSDDLDSNRSKKAPLTHWPVYFGVTARTGQVD